MKNLSLISILLGILYVSGISSDKPKTLSEEHGVLNQYQSIEVNPRFNKRTLLLDRHSNFYFHSESCKQEWKYKGEYERSGDTLFIIPEGKVPIPHWYFIILWSGFEILVQESMMDFFVNEFNSGSLLEYNGGNDSLNLSVDYLSNIPNEAVHTLRGAPVVPLAYSDALKIHPISTTVLSKDFDNYSVVLDKGESEGIWLGMKLYPKNGNPVGTFLIIELHEHTSIAQEYTFNSKDVMSTTIKQLPTSTRKTDPERIQKVANVSANRIFDKIQTGTELTSVRDR